MKLKCRCSASRDSARWVASPWTSTNRKKEEATNDAKLNYYYFQVKATLEFPFILSFSHTLSPPISLYLDFYERHIWRAIYLLYDPNSTGVGEAPTFSLSVFSSFSVISMILNPGIFMHLFGRISRRYMKKKDSRNYFGYVFTGICFTAGTIIIIIQKKRGLIWIKQRHYRYTPYWEMSLWWPWLFDILLCCCGLFYSCLQFLLVTFWDLLHVHFACGTYLM